MFNNNDRKPIRETEEELLWVFQVHDIVGKCENKLNYYKRNLESHRLQRKEQKKGS